MTRRRAGTVPLARALSKLGLASRTDARTLIAAGRVRVADVTVTDPGRLVVPERIQVTIDDVRQSRPPRRLLAFHKPRGVITSRRDEKGRRTVYDVLGDAAAGLMPIGRLDMASTGLLLFTNDTRILEALTDPARQVPRRYVVTVRGEVRPETAERLVAGLTAPPARGRGRPERLSACDVDIRKASSRETHLLVTLMEGRNRELRRLFEGVGHEVTRVHRVAFGAIELGTLQPGAWRELDTNTVLQGKSSRP